MFFRNFMFISKKQLNNNNTPKGCRVNKLMESLSMCKCLNAFVINILYANRALTTLSL